MSLVLEHVGKDVGGQAHIRDVSLTLEPGVINVLLGPTLTGKTSLMRLMAGLDRPTAGRIPLPGGDFAPDGLPALIDATVRAHPYLDRALAERLVRAYGTRVTKLLGGAHAMSDLGADFGAGLTEREVDYLMREEWAQTADDVLWRRSKLGLRFSAAQTAALDNVMRRKADAAPSQDERRRA